MSEFNTLQQRYIEWLATPRLQRSPSKQPGIAAELGKSTRTLQRWQKLPGFWDAVIALSRQMLRERLPDVYGAIAREAEKGSHQHARLALEVTNELQQTGTDETPFVISIQYGNDNA